MTGHREAIAIVSGKGGVGKSTVSACLAHAFAARGRRVLLIDCDIGLRSLDMILGVEEHVLFTWADAALGRCDLSQAVMPCGENLHLLCAPSQPEQGLNENMLRDLVKSCGQYDTVLVDAPAGIGFGFRLSVGAALRCLVVSTPDPVCVRSVSAAARQALRLGCKDVRLVINRFDRQRVQRGEMMMLDDIIDLTECQLIGIIPQQTRLFAQTAGGALQENAVTQAAARIAARLEGENVPLVIPTAG